MVDMQALHKKAKYALENDYTDRASDLEDVARAFVNGVIEDPITTRLLTALQAMVIPFVKGSHYHTQNPYTRSYVEQALKTIAEAKKFEGNWMDVPLDRRSIERQ